MNRIKWLTMCLVLVLWGLVFAGSASASLVINVDVGNNGGTYSGQGAYADPGNDFWNGFATDGTNLKASDGVAVTGVSVSIGNTGGFQIGSMTNKLMKDYRFVTGGNSGTITISGLDANADYLIYVYAYSETTNKQATVTLNGVTAPQTTGASDPEIFVEGSNYVIIATQSDSAGIIAGTFRRDPAGESDLSGLQIISLGRRGAAHTPVPTNWANPVDPETVNAVSWYSPEQDEYGVTVDDPNLVVNGYDVWFGTAEPNELSDTPTSTMSQSYPVSLAYDTTYYWRVDTHVTWDSNEITGNFTEIIEGPVWQFTVLPTFALTFEGVITTMDLRPVQLAATLAGNPAAIAGADIQFSLLQDDYQFPAGAVASVTPTTTVNTNPTATLTTDTPGTYKVKLAVSDGGSNQAEKTVLVRVYSDACAAKKAAPSGWTVNYYDRDSNCSVTVSDLAVFAAQWLNDTSMIAQATDTGDSGYPGI